MSHVRSTQRKAPIGIHSHTPPMVTHLKGAKEHNAKIRAAILADNPRAFEGM